MDYEEILLRLTAAVLIGGLIGLDRTLRGKPTGICTFGLVSLGACLLTMAGMNVLTAHGEADLSSVSRVIQELITGIGFLGAGVIVHEPGSDRIRGHTTAASIWIAAILGILCGMEEELLRCGADQSLDSVGLFSAELIASQQAVAMSRDVLHMYDALRPFAPWQQFYAEK